jgi:uncharacterized membrane protein
VALWKAAHFQIPIIDHLENGFIPQLGDHFSPSLYLLSPLYWFTKSYTALLVLQNICYVVSAFIIYLIAHAKTKRKFISFALTMAYTMFIGMQNALIANFHTEIPALMTLSLALFYLNKKRFGYFLLFFAITLGFKETFFPIGVLLGLYLVFIHKKKLGLFMMIFSIAYYFFITKIIIPAIIKQPYFYANSIPSVPILFTNFFPPPIKIWTMFVSFATFGFLPLFAPAFLPVILQDYFVRFSINNTPLRIDLGLHYNAMVTLLLAYGSILGVMTLLKTKWYRKIIPLHAFFIIFVSLFFHYKLHGALGLAFNPAFYAHTKNLNFLREFVAKIPKDKKMVMTQNNIAPYLAHDTDVMLLRLNYWRWMPDVIAIDLRDGQSANNYWPLPPQQFNELHDILEKDKNYTKTFVSKNQIYYIKKNHFNMDRYKRIIL